jgi:hypothetical protein
MALKAGIDRPTERVRGGGHVVPRLKDHLLVLAHRVKRIKRVPVRAEGGLQLGSKRADPCGLRQRGDWGGQQVGQGHHAT